MNQSCQSSSATMVMLIKGKDQFGNNMVMSKVIRLMNKQDLVTNCLAYFAELGVPAPDRSTIFRYLAECFPGMFSNQKNNF